MIAPTDTDKNHNEHDERVYHYRWEWNLRAAPEALWPLVADTNRFNLDTNLPPVKPVAGAAEQPKAQRRLSFRRLGIRIEWDEEPFEWVRPYRFGVVRRYRSGPLAEMRVLVELSARSDGGTHVSYQVWAWPAGPFGRLIIPIQIGLLSARSFNKAFRRYDEMAVSGQQPMSEAGARLTAGGRQRLTSLRDKLLDAGANQPVFDLLQKHIEQADDLTLSRIRPYVLADYWSVKRSDVLELCLWATRAGLLDLQWDVLCPLCRGEKSSADSLFLVQPEVHCSTCKIDFHVNFEHLVELTFRPNAAIRQVSGSEFCVAGPRVTPHVEIQQLLPPGAQQLVSPLLEAGRYRLRTLELPGGQFLRTDAQGTRELTLTASRSSGWPVDEIAIAPAPALRLENLTEHEQLFVLEHLEWSDQAVTAAEVIALQVFRDLFADEILRPGEQISVGSMTILFTDLRDSTLMYRDIGDAPAFGVVLDHFKLLR